MAKILRSPYPDIKIPEDISLPAYLLNKLSQYGDEKAMICARTDRYITYRQIVSSTNSLTLGLQSIGLTKGVVFCACLANCFEYVPLALAVTSLGSIFATANPDYSEDELIYLFNQCKAKYVIVDDVTSAKVSNIRTKCPSIKKINPKTDIAFYLSSSGTTGMPKTVMLTHYSTVAMMHALRDIKAGDFRHYATTINQIYCTVFQYCNIAGIVCTLFRPLQEGSTCIGLFPKYQSKLFFESIGKYKVTALFLAPPVLVYLTKMPNKERYNLSSVRAILCGGAPLSLEVNESTCSLLNLPYVTEEYGMTETNSITHMTPVCKLSERKLGSCGMLIANTLCKVIDVNTGRLLGPNEEGEVCVKGPQNTIGYLDNYKATYETIDNEGWLHTGDIGYYDDDEYLYICDRIKELIKVKGYQVAPAELENILLTHPSVADSAVFGIPDDYSGERLFAYIVPKPNVVVTEEEMKDFVARKVVPYKRLEGGVKFVDSIPKSPSGKILRRFLRDEYRQRSTTSKL